MAVNSINTNIAAYFAQSNINQASTNVSLSVARLSSGNRIIRSSDDVAGLSIGTSLRTNVATLRIAKLNTSQGNSLLQVADGSLAQVSEILQRQKAIAVQASSGSLANTQRAFLNQEFQALTSEIDRLVGNTNFNGVKLLNGTLSTQSSVSASTNQASAGSMTINLAVNPAASDTFSIAGQTLTAVATLSPSTAQFTIGSTTAETINNLAAKLNTLAENASYSTTIGQAKYSAVGSSLVITSRTGGALSNNFIVQMSGTVTTANDAATSGSYGGTSFNVFATGFANTTDTVSITTGVAATPFQIGDTITAQIAGGQSNVLYTIAAGDTLQTIVNGINATSDSTGVKASLVFSQTAKTYNIRLSYASSVVGTTLSLGTNYSGGTYGLNGAQANATTGVGTTSPTGGTVFQFAAYRDLFTAAALNVSTGNLTVSDVALASPSQDVAPFRDGDTISATINGRRFDLYTIGTGTTTVANIVTGINANTATTGIYAAVVGSTGAYNIRLYFGDSTNSLDPDAGSGLYTSGSISSNTSGSTATGATLSQTTRYGLSGGSDNGLGFASTSVSGSSGDNLITGLAQNRAKVVLNFPEIADGDLTSTSNFNSDGSVYITVAGKTFTFNDTSATAKSPDEITIGSTLKDTLDNAVSTINRYFADGYALGTTAYELNQLKVFREGNSLVFEGKSLKDLTQIDGSTTATVALSGTFVSGASLTNSGNLDNGSGSSTYGVDVTGISNAKFTGSISGFTASYVSADTVDVSVKVGDYTYTAKSIDSTPTSNTTIRFISNTLADGTNGGYFDVQLQANKGVTVASSADTPTLAGRFDAAFSSLTFYQQRNISSYTGSSSITSDGAVIGSLLGTKVSAKLESFTDLKLESLSVTAPNVAGADGKITLKIGGVNYSTGSGIGDQLGANQTYRLTSEEDPTFYVEFTTGNSAIDFSTDAKALAVQTALQSAFGAGNGSAALSFQVGTTSDDTLSVSIGDVTTKAIFKGATLDVLTQEAATAASDAIDAAIEAVTSVRADVGALQSRFNYASASIESTIQNQDAARGELLDTDIATESTSFAVSQVKLQAGISTLAQANLQLQSLLKLIG